jgi:Zn-finger nucleic acid-binding protein
MMPAPVAARPACPHCTCAMREVSARARTGYMILLDQCPQCGGVWCDRWELFPLAAEEAERIDAVDASQLYAPSPASANPGRCPRCTTPLRPFRDPLLPADARVERCHVCDGMWMNRGELTRFTQHAPRNHARADLAQLAARLGTAASWAKVSNLDAATYARDDEDADEATNLGATLASAGPWIVLRSLLRLLLGV